jgi:hypothetical protein
VNLQQKSTAVKLAVNPVGPIARVLSELQTRKFERALSMPALLASSGELLANGDNDDDDVDLGFGIRS